MQNVSNCLVLRFGLAPTADDERNGPSKHVEIYGNCRINTYRNCILLVCLYNCLRFTVRTMSNFPVFERILEHVSPTHISRETCRLRRSVMVPAQAFELRKNLITLSLAKAEIKLRRSFKNL